MPDPAADAALAALAPPDDDPEAPAPRPPMEAAKELVQQHREKKRLERELATVTTKIAALSKGEVLYAIDGEDFPESSRVDGASVFLWTQVWASPAKTAVNDKGEEAADHDHLTAVLDGLGLHHLKPSTVNTQSLSAYVREQVDNAPFFDDDGNALDLEARARLVLPASLVDALNLTMKREVHVNGA